MAKLITERTAFSGGRVTGTAEAPVIEGVLLCGAVSANRRRYLRKAFEGKRVERYNGRPVGTYHADANGHRYLEQLGIVQNARHRSDGMPVGDLHINPEKPGAKAFLWDAKYQPKACAMSHVAQCETARGRDGWEEVTEVVRVESVDVIGAGGAATTTSLFENRNRRKTVKLSKLLERIAGAPKATRAVKRAAQLLREDVDADAEVPADAGVSDDMGVGDMDEEEVTAALESGYEAALAAVVKGALLKDAAAVGKRVTKLIKAFQAAKGGDEKGVEAAAESRVTWSDGPARVREKKFAPVHWDDAVPTTGPPPVHWAD